MDSRCSLEMPSPLSWLVTSTLEAWASSLPRCPRALHDHYLSSVGFRVLSLLGLCLLQLVEFCYHLWAPPRQSWFLCLAGIAVLPCLLTGLLSLSVLFIWALLTAPVTGVVMLLDLAV
jgi:hypothetical protein